MDESVVTWVDRYLGHLRTERRYSPHTIKNYARDLRALIRFCDRQELAGWKTLDSFHMRQFVATSHRSGLAPRSIQRQLSAVRSFFFYLIREGELDANPAVDVPAPKASRRLPKTLDTDQMARLLEIPRDDPLALRDWAIMELLYSSGLRLAELTTLDLADLDLRDATVRVTGKGGKTRILPVGAYATQALQEWLKTRPGIAAGTESALFVGKRGKRISPRSVQARVRYWARRQGIAEEVSPHLFRHSFASHLLESSGDLRSVQELLGHADIGTTQIYTHLDFQHLARIYDASHPRARRKR